VGVGNNSRKPPMRLQGVSVAIVVRARESRVHGAGPQLERGLNVRPWRMLRRGILSDVGRKDRGETLSGGRRVR
jgi:hypothetical protein